MYISAADMEADIRDFDEKYGKPLNLRDRIASTSPEMAIAAEFKRASPSKGDISPDLDSVTQCMEYARVGAAVISVLTEFKWFKGTLTDMKRVRLASQAELGDKRPAVLRKDFILDRYQVLEARSHGADTLLLIVAILGVNQLKDLLMYSRSLGMEPLVEVHSNREMEIALSVGAQVIGVNNRNLHDFRLDLDTTERVIQVAAAKGLTWKIENDGAWGIKMPDIMIAALSGITNSDDVSLFRKAGVSCVLVGETLMRSPDPRKTIAELLGDGSHVVGNKKVLVKTCGITNAADANGALQAGANFIGIIFAKSPRTATMAQAIEVVETTRKYGERTKAITLESEINKLGDVDRSNSKVWFDKMNEILTKITFRRPLVVGVFQNQNSAEINEIVSQSGIDIVQLHGDESSEVVKEINAPCIKVLHLAPASAKDSIHHEDNHSTIDRLKKEIDSFSGKAVAILLDSRSPGTAGGGTGATFDWSIAGQLEVPVILAGGLKTENVQEAAHCAGVVGVDVSSGVEKKGEPGTKDLVAMKQFVLNARI